jgi:hypothetical protein
MKAKETTAHERRTALQYRCGQLYNNKLAMRWGHTTTDKCPLCGQPDGGHHIASGCKALTKMYLARHHQAGRMILKAILKGERAAETAYADVGSKENLQKDGASLTDGRHPLSLPKGSTRPDIILAATRDKPEKGYKAITLVEIKYCRDTDPQTQKVKAVEQHKALKEHLQRQHKCRVDTLPILLGASGAIYYEYTQVALGRLGVGRGGLKRLIVQLHRHAVQSLSGITRARRRQERKCNKHPPYRSRGRQRPLTSKRGNPAGWTSKSRQRARLRARTGTMDNG